MIFLLLVFIQFSLHRMKKTLMAAGVTHFFVWVLLLELLQDLGHVSPGLLLVQVLLIQIQTQGSVQEVDGVRVQHLSIHLNVHLHRKGRKIVRRDAKTMLC